MRTEIGFWACIVSGNIHYAAGSSPWLVLMWAAIATIFLAKNWTDALRRRKD